MSSDKLLELLSLIDAEAYGRCRRYRIINLSRLAKLETKKMERKHKKHATK